MAATSAACSACSSAGNFKTLPPFKSDASATRRCHLSQLSRVCVNFLRTFWISQRKRWHFCLTMRILVIKIMIPKFYCVKKEVRTSNMIAYFGQNLVFQSQRLVSIWICNAQESFVGWFIYFRLSCVMQCNACFWSIFRRDKCLLMCFHETSWRFFKAVP